MTTEKGPPMPSLTRSKLRSGVPYGCPMPPARMKPLCAVGVLPKANTSGGRRRPHAERSIVGSAMVPQLIDPQTLITFRA